MNREKNYKQCKRFFRIGHVSSARLGITAPLKVTISPTAGDSSVYTCGHFYQYGPQTCINYFIRYSTKQATICPKLSEKNTTLDLSRDFLRNLQGNFASSDFKLHNKLRT